MTNRTDAFTRADSITALGTPTDAGSAWVAAAGTWGISSNTGYKVATSSVFETAYLEASVTDVEVQATLSVLGTVKIGGLTARVASDTDFLLGYVDNSGANTNAYVYKKVANTFTQLATSAAVTVAANDVMKLRIDSANQLTFYQNGVSIVTGNDSAGSTNTKGGLMGYAAGIGGAMQFDDFSITAIASGDTLMAQACL